MLSIPRIVLHIALRAAYCDTPLKWHYLRPTSTKGVRLQVVLPREQEPSWFQYGRTHLLEMAFSVAHLSFLFRGLLLTNTILKLKSSV